MTSQLDDGDGSYGYSATKPIHFFRIMLHENLLQGNLRLPEKFVRKYGNHLSNSMLLKLPNGVEWKVNLEKRDGSVWFQEGWKDFAEYYSLANGHLLGFRYDGTSHFHVFICDMSTMEIEYPVNKANHKRPSINSEESQPHKTQKTDENMNKSKGNMEGSSISNCGTHEAAGNTSFTVIMKSSYVSKRIMYLPKSPLKRYTKSGEQYVKLLVGDRSWRVKVIYCRNKTLSYFTGDWLVFAKENDLKEGDACLFQLLSNGDGIVMKVSISRRV
ncbi:B3 domain-containing protein [Glycine soja]|uniref:B3 domain-containing protein n=1 Tax=Glycine soja TaxID=3848 RepID=A0A445JNS5_GLYSO|nr:B3 domain-containing protein [Glycine soja]